MKGGRYGAYVTAGGVNATIPSDKTQETITLEEAIALIDERVAKGGSKTEARRQESSRPRRPSPRRPTRRQKKPRQERPAAKKAASKPKSDCHQQGAPPVAAPQDIADQDTPAAKAGREEERRQDDHG